MEFTQIKYQDAATQTYIGSPSVLRLPNGDILATHDYFGPGCPRNHEREEHLMSVYRSRDNGATWENVTHVAGQYWSNLFEHRGAIYLLGVSQQFGSIVIRRSDDGGNTWTHPWDEHSGLLFRGGYYHDDPNYHCAPMPMVKHNGWVYRAFEDCSGAQWPVGFMSCVIAAPEEADLLDASSWVMSNKVPFDRSWLPAQWPPLDAPGFLEGNVVETPEGGLCNILRLHSSPLADKAVVLQVEHHDRELRQQFVEIMDFPGGMTKFTIRRDTQTGTYLTLCNNNTDPRFASQRNVLSLYSSQDLRHWTHRLTLLEDDRQLSGGGELSWEESVRLTGFQYVDWQFDGADLIYAVRVAYDGAHNFHDANRLTFARLEGYQQYL